MLLASPIVVFLLAAPFAGIKCAQVNFSEKLSNSTTKLSNSTNAENSTISNQDQLPCRADEPWNFEVAEVDLMDFLQELSARYQSAANSSLTGDASHLLSGGLKSSEDDKLEPKLLQDPSKQPEQQGSNKTAQADPAVGIEPSIPDQEVGESSWQYGMFDRFTRAKSTSTTPEPKYTLPNGVELDVRNFNLEECGLRTYEDTERPYQAFPSNPLDSEASKELLHRRQRPKQELVADNVDSDDVSGPYESIADLVRRPQQNVEQQQQEQSATSQRQSSTSGWTNKDEHQVYDENNLDKQQQQKQIPVEQVPNGAQSSPTIINDGDEFNLLSRRNWLQQQLGSTLQMFGLNASSGSAAAMYSQSSGLNSRENMMKLSAKSGKAIELPIEIPSSLPSLRETLNGRQDELKLEPRVIGGSDARLGDSPWSVSLQALVSRPGTNQVEYRHYCGGTIISEQYVLTAAHCLDFMVGRESRLFVVVGDLNWRMNPASLFGRRYAIDKLIIHGSYKNTAFGHDIGLIRTKEPIRPLKRNGKYIINSVCLPEKGVEHSGDAELVGWGLFSNRNEMADSLQIADVPILPRPLCVDLYRRRTGLIQWLIGIELITDKQVCAGTFGRGICQGDSGSALVFNDRVGPNVSNSGEPSTSPEPLGPFAGPSRNKKVGARQNQYSSRATIIGIVAFGGIRRCSYQSLPGVYMQTSKYLDWILPRIQA